MPVLSEQQRIELLALDLGININNRLPYAREVFKVTDVDLLPHTSKDTLLAELYEWSGRNYRTHGTNVIGYLYEDAEKPSVVEQLRSVKRYDALLPNFEFDKEHILELGGSLPSFFDLVFKGKLTSTRKLNVKVMGITKARLTNIEQPGIDIRRRLSEFAQKRSKTYRHHVKNEYLATALFYADSVEVTLEKGAGQEIEVSFDPGAKVEVSMDNSTTKKFVLSYNGNACPFGATMSKGKDFMERR